MKEPKEENTRPTVYGIYTEEGIFKLFLSKETAEKEAKELRQEHPYDLFYVDEVTIH